MPVDLNALHDLLRTGPLTVLTGAGISTDSGIPDYRGPKTRHIARNPIQHDDFVRHPEARRRYWSRASRGFVNVDEAVPNASHRALAQLEQGGHIEGIITQNVDGLHQRSGSRKVIELHGTLHKVCCLACAKTYERAEVQGQIEQDNPGWIRPTAAVAPDGDAELVAAEYARFKEPRCVQCSGPLMPDVVFFGGAVPKMRSQAAYDMVAGSQGLLVLGSSLTVYSGYRFVRFAERLELPIAIVTLGETRGDKHACCKVDAPLCEVLPALAQQLCPAQELRAS